MDAFRHCNRFAGFVLPGKQSIKGEHRNLLIETRASRVSASMDFEAALANVDLDCKRFDYFIATSHEPERCHAVEVHAFKPTELVEKKHGTVELLGRHCPASVAQVASWQVLVKGEMPRADLAARFQADNRIRIAGRTLDIVKL